MSSPPTSPEVEPCPETSKHRLIQAKVAPVDENGIAAAVTGTIAFAIATVICWLNHDWLAAREHAWWLWVAVIGVAFGCCLLAYFTIRQRWWARPKDGYQP